MGCKSLVQEVIEAAGHICIFLPKFHCELNFIEFFWCHEEMPSRVLWLHLFQSPEEHSRCSQISWCSYHLEVSIGWSDGWMPTGREKVQKRPRFRSKSLELTNRSLIGRLVRQSPGGKGIWLDTKIGPIRLISGHLADVAWEWPISECPK